MEEGGGAFCISLSLSRGEYKGESGEREGLFASYFISDFFLFWNLSFLSLDVRFALVLVLPPQIERASECRRPTTTKRTLGALPFPLQALLGERDRARLLGVYLSASSISFH